jgi:hypothetical protein
MMPSFTLFELVMSLLLLHPQDMVNIFCLFATVADGFTGISFSFLKSMGWRRTMMSVHRMLIK